MPKRKLSNLLRLTIQNPGIIIVVIMENIYGVLSDSILSLKEKLRGILENSDKNVVREFFEQADDLRKVHFKNQVSLCAIINAKSGKCGEDCSYCAQSARHKADIESYPLVEPEVIIKKAREAFEQKASCFSIVTSGRGIDSQKEISSIARTIELLAKKFPTLKRSASLGIINKENLATLRDAGLEKYHHNLESSKNFFPNISKTHSFEEKTNVVLMTKALGLEICSGGIFGLGESWDDRIDLALTLNRLKVDSVPINFLNPIKGTPMGSRPLVDATEALKIIALFRIILRDRDIKVCGGRAIVLKDEDKLIFGSGASGMMIGNYLTTSGLSFDRDQGILRELGLVAVCR